MAEAAARYDDGSRPAGARILVVEDEDMVAQGMADTLEAFGYQVVGFADSAPSAVACAHEKRPDLVLMDIGLSRGDDGIEAAAKIRRFHSVPIIFVSGRADEETLTRATSSSPAGYLLKPLRAAELRCAIELALQRHELERKLRERERWLAITLRSIGDGVIASDPERRISLFNAVAETLTGWSRAEALGRPLREVVQLVPDTRDGKPLPDGSIAMKMVARDGTSIPVENSVSPIVDEDGSVMGAVTVLRDVSLERALERRLRGMNDELERRVVERTAELEASNRELESFCYAVAHDLRTPLRGIDGFSQVLIDEYARALGDDGTAMLDRVRQAAQRMSQIIEDLLRLSRITRAGFARESVDLSRATNQIVARLRAADPRRQVEVLIGPRVTAHGDESLLEILLECLLGNAWKFSAHVEHARIEFGELPGEQGPVYFVRDNGAGFDMRYAHKLFSPFQRLHSLREYPGTGIGLAIVQRVVDRHNGKVWAESAPGQGATVFFTL